MKVYEYVLRIKDQASSRLRTLRNMAINTSRSIRGFAGQLRGLGGQIIDVFGAGMAARLAPAAIAAGIGLLSTRAVALAADLEQTQVGFEVFLDSAERASEMVKDLRQMAKVTPFETRDLVKATETMLGFGIAGDKILDNLRMLGDVSRGDANRLRLISLAFSQISAAGKLTGQDLLQLINAGFNPLQEISRLTGRSLAELREDMQEGNITFAMVEEAFRSATSEGGRFFRMMERQSQTFRGISSTLRDEWNEALTTLGQKLLPDATKGLLIMQGILHDLTNNVDWTPLVSAITDTREAIIELVNMIGPGQHQLQLLQVAVNALAFSVRMGTLPLRTLIFVLGEIVLLLQTGAKAAVGLGKAIIGLATHDLSMMREGFTATKESLKTGISDMFDRAKKFYMNEAEGFASIFTTGPQTPFPGTPAGSPSRASMLAPPGKPADKLKSGLDKISAGGRTAVNVTINLDNLIGVQNFDVKNVRESMRDMEKAVLEALLRVVNSAQYAASQ